MDADGFSAKTCRDGQKPPSIMPGDFLDSGRYYRNLRDAEVASLYSKAPELGSYVKTNKARKWTDISAQRGFSVNETTCAGCPLCSILVNGNAGDYRHVAEFDISEINRFLAPDDDRFIAYYRPVTEGEFTNACHFEIWTLNGTLMMAQVLDLLDAFIRRLPTKANGQRPDRPTETDMPVVLDAIAVYGKIVQIHRSVIHQDVI